MVYAAATSHHMGMQRKRPRRGRGACVSAIFVGLATVLGLRPAFVPPPSPAPTPLAQAFGVATGALVGSMGAFAEDLDLDPASKDMAAVLDETSAPMFVFFAIVFTAGSMALPGMMAYMVSNSGNINKDVKLADDDFK